MAADTEMPERSGGQNSAALASSIFLVARKRDVDAGVGSEADVMAELDKIIAERLDRLQQLGVTGSTSSSPRSAQGLRALTRYERVEQDNGELLPAERFLAVVQGQGSRRDLRLTRQRRPSDALLPRSPVLLWLRGGAVR